MWLQQQCEYLIFFIVAVLQVELQATVLRQTESQSYSKDTLDSSAHRGAGAPNDYGPPIKITSSILQLTKASGGSTNIADIQHHEATIDNAWTASAAQSGAAGHSGWLDATTSVHAIPVALEVNVADDGDYNPWQPHSIASGVFSHDGGLELSHGLHTQIISSGSSSGSLAISDNLDFENVAERKVNRHHETSYGR